MPRGRSASSTRSNSSDVELEGLAQSELEKLRHQFRIMEGDHQAYSVESQELIRKQLAEIEKLEKDDEELTVNLKLCVSQTRQKQHQEYVKKIRSKLESQDKLKEQIDSERQTIVELDLEIKKLEQKLLEQKIALSKCTESKEINAQTQKDVKVMENTLDRTLTRFNTQLTQNALLREEIRTMSMERSRFQHLYHKLEKELQETRKEVGAVIDMSTAAYDARDDAQTKMVQLKEKAEKDLVLHAAEMKELQRVIDHDRKLKEFMAIKTQERPSEEIRPYSTRKREDEGSAKRQKETKEERAETFEAAFQQIRAATGEEDLEVLVNTFIEVEDRNFALFSYINEQNTEIERVQEEIAALQAEIAGFRQREQELQWEQQRVRQQMERQQQEASNQAAGYEERVKAVNKILEQLKTGTESLFTKIGCNRSILDDMLGSSCGITDTTIMQYLGLIEQRTNQLLSIQSYLTSKDYDRPYDPREAAVLLLGQKLEGAMQPLYIEPPTTGNNDDDSELESPGTEEERPLTQAELRERIMKGVIRKEEKALKKGFQSYRPQLKH
ncbi:coiled-coil domain-containing protein 114 [Callorhinchus milii]|nr:coiled-coil domain-containing protein 114 [Callorhinchus milii]|eukprot:gi/632960200/ref/XP_007896059.1/ PREDICTED: coiled-coil domain-containing protein 63-like [Callorhinchus milii]